MIMTLEEGNLAKSTNVDFTSMYDAIILFWNTEDASFMLPAFKTVVCRLKES
jgi:DNA polymerase elongation subunit (family B)